MATDKDFSKKKDADLRKVLKEKQEKIRELRFAVAGAGEKDVKARKNLKKDVARILTELRNRELQA